MTWAPAMPRCGDALGWSVGLRRLGSGKWILV